MTESQFTSKLLKALRAHPALREVAVVVKHCNPYHRGVPDFSVSIGPRTLWVEVKEKGEKPEKIQDWHLQRMDGAVLWFRQPGDAGLIRHRNVLAGWFERDTKLVAWIIRAVIHA